MKPPPWSHKFDDAHVSIVHNGNALRITVNGQGANRDTVHIEIDNASLSMRAGGTPNAPIGTQRIELTHEG